MNLQQHPVRQDFMAVNLAHGELRRRLVTAEHLKRMEAAMGKEDAEMMLGSGITGVTPGKVTSLSQEEASNIRFQQRFSAQV